MKLLSLLLLALALQAQSDVTIFHDGKIFFGTADSRTAPSMAVRGDRILALGTTAELRRQYPGAQLQPLAGRTVIPGLIDTHTHSLSFATARVLGELDLRYPEVGGIDDILRLIADRVKRAQPGEWILGNSWDDGTFREHRYITRADLDTVAPNNPVYLFHVTGHLAALNSAALKIAGITKDTPDPLGGIIHSDSNHNPTGVLMDNAMNLVRPHLPKTTPATLIQAVDYLSKACAEVGLTTIHNTSLMPEHIAAYQAARAQGLLQVRVRLIPMVSTPASVPRILAMGVSTGFGDSMLKLGAVKFMSDGGMAARTIAINNPPVVDEPTNTGLLIWKTEDLEKAHLDLARQGWQLSTHAIGDRAIHQVLDSYAKVAQALPGKDLRSRIVHGGIITPPIQQRLKQYSVLVDSNPAFVRFLGRHFPRYSAGGRDRWIYPAKTYFDQGITASGGSDVGVSPLSPWWGLGAAVIREEMMSGQVLVPEERVSIAQALRMFTYNGAYTSFEENDLGSLEPGKLADFLVLDRDLLTIPGKDIYNVKVLQTWVGGKKIFDRSGTR